MGTPVMSPFMKRFGYYFYFLWLLVAFPVALSFPLFAHEGRYLVILSLYEHFILVGFFMISSTDKSFSYWFFQVFNLLFLTKFLLVNYYSRGVTSFWTDPLMVVVVVVFGIAAYLRYRIWTDWKAQQSQATLPEKRSHEDPASGQE